MEQQKQCLFVFVMELAFNMGSRGYFWSITLFLLYWQFFRTKHFRFGLILWSISVLPPKKVVNCQFPREMKSPCVGGKTLCGTNLFVKMQKLTFFTLNTKRYCLLTYSTTEGKYFHNRIKIRNSTLMPSGQNSTPA